MRQILLIIFLCMGVFFSAQSQTLVHYWNFNNSTNETNLLTSTSSIVPGASIVHNSGANSGGFVSVIQTTSNTAQGFDVTNPNARNGDAALTHLRFNNPIGGNLVFSLPTTGYENVVVKYATRRSGSGAHNQVIDYSLDGSTFVNLTTLQPLDGNPTLQTLDFSSIAAADNNPNFKIRISFTQGGGGLEGNNRFDNFTLDADPVVLATEQLIHYWNFNNAPSKTALLTPSASLIPGASIAATEPGTTLVDWENGMGQNFDVQNLNARNGDMAGTHFRYNFPVPGQITFNLPTTQTTEIVVKYVTRRSGSGAGTQLVEYSTDGVNFMPVARLTITETPTLQSFNFRDSAGVNNNPNFKIRIQFEATNGGAVGNNRFDNFTVDGKSNYVNPGPPAVVLVPANNATQVSPAVNPTITFSADVRLINNSLITNENVASLLTFKLNNADGVNVPFTATYNNKVITVVPSAPLAAGGIYYLALNANVVEGTNDVAIETAQATTFTVLATSFITFGTSPFLSVSEADGNAFVTFNLTNPIQGSFKISLMPAPWSNAVPTEDFSFASTIINTTAATPTLIGISIPIINDNLSELDEYFVLGLEELNGYTLQGRKYLTIYIRDNDRKAPIPTQQLTLNYVGSFKPGAGAASTAEVSAYDPATKRLFITSGVQNRLDIADFSNPNSVQHIKSVDLSPYGGGVNGVAFRNGMVALAIDNIDPQANGFVVFFNTNGDFLKQVTVGAMPDMITFTPDSSKILTANEGEPNNAYTVDPEGSVSIIDVSGGIGSVDQSKVTTVLFTDFNAQEAALIAAGVRKLKSTSTLSQDLEPEYITFSADGSKAWIACQENNSIAELDIANKNFTRIWGLGLKDYNTVAGGGLDASNNGGVVHISNWPVKSYYMPDGMSSYTVGGKTYIVTANEGDEKELAGLNERTTVGAVPLDPVKFPHAAMLKEPFNIGNFRITNLNGDNDNDGDYDDVINIGARSFSIWDSETGALVWDSKDQIELFIAQHPQFGAIFNADHGNNNRKGRSHSKGPEPEGITLAEINGEHYAFVVMERIGGTLVYNISDPTNPVLSDYRNERTLNAFGGDLGGETSIYIKAENSPDGKHYLLVSNEVSGNLTIYQLGGEVLPVRLISFDGVLQNNSSAYLSWKVENDADLLGFELERSQNGRDFSRIASMNQIEKLYSYLDKNIPEGKNLYRLKILEKDGTFYHSQQVVVNRGAVPSYVIGMMQNPVTTTANLSVYSAGNQRVQANIIDMHGKRLSTVQMTMKPGTNQIGSNVLGLAAGMYFMVIEAEDGLKQAVKFMKQ